MYSAGTTNVAPAATTPAAWPTLWTMTFSRMVLLGIRSLPKKIARIAIGIEASMALPARRAMYDAAAVKTTTIATPRPIDHRVTSGRRSSGPTTGS
jgi:hypothetical protein